VYVGMISSGQFLKCMLIGADFDNEWYRDTGQHVEAPKTLRIEALRKGGEWKGVSPS